MDSNKNRRKTIFWIIVAIMFFSGGLGKVLGGLAIGALTLGGISLFIVGLIVLIRRMLNASNYSEMDAQKKQMQQEQKNKVVNPYSSAITIDKVVNGNTTTTTIKSTPKASQTSPFSEKAATQSAKQPYATTNNSAQVNKAPEKPAKPSTGDKDIDKMIDERDKAIREMHRLNDNIDDEKLSAQIDHLEDITTKIVAFVIDHPKKKKQVKKFFDYYLPTTLKLLNAYDRADEAGISGTNIDGTKGKVEDMMDTALAAFDKQLDALFADDALDVSTDISVMENMLRAEGLTDDELMKEAKAAAKVLSEDKSKTEDEFLNSLKNVDEPISLKL